MSQQDISQPDISSAAPLETRGRAPSSRPRSFSHLSAKLKTWPSTGPFHGLIHWTSGVTGGNCVSEIAQLSYETPWTRDTEFRFIASFTTLLAQVRITVLRK